MWRNFIWSSFDYQIQRTKKGVFGYIIYTKTLGSRNSRFGDPRPLLGRYGRLRNRPGNTRARTQFVIFLGELKNLEFILPGIWNFVWNDYFPTSWVFSEQLPARAIPWRRNSLKEIRERPLPSGQLRPARGQAENRLRAKIVKGRGGRVLWFWAKFAHEIRYHALFFATHKWTRNIWLHKYS